MLGIVFSRIKRVLSLDREIFAEARDDKNALVSGAVIVIIASIFISIGGLFESFFVPGIEERSGFFGTQGSGMLDIVILPIIALIMWPIITGYFHIFCKLVGGKATYTGFLRATALTYSPGVLAIIPFTGFLMYSIANLFFIYRAIREAHEFTRGNAIIVFIIAWIVLIFITFGIMITLINVWYEEGMVKLDELIADDDMDYFEIGSMYLFIPTAKKELEADYDLVVLVPLYVVNNGTGTMDMEIYFNVSSDSEGYIDRLLPGESFETTLWLWVPLPEECEEYHDLQIEVEKPKKWSKTLPDYIQVNRPPVPEIEFDCPKEAENKLKLKANITNTGCINGTFELDAFTNESYLVVNPYYVNVSAKSSKTIDVEIDIKELKDIKEITLAVESYEGFYTHKSCNVSISNEV